MATKRAVYGFTSVPPDRYLYGTFYISGHRMVIEEPKSNYQIGDMYRMEIKHGSVAIKGTWGPGAENMVFNLEKRDSDSGISAAWHSVPASRSFDDAMRASSEWVETKNEKVLAKRTLTGEEAVRAISPAIGDAIREWVKKASVFCSYDSCDREEVELDT